MQQLTSIITPPIIVAVAIMVWLYVAINRWRFALIVDALLVVAFYRRPSPATLLLVLVLVALRWVPTFAVQLAAPLKLETMSGLTVRAALVLLPALTRYTDTNTRAQTAPSTSVNPGASTRQQTSAAATGDTIKLTRAEWTRQANDEPDQYPMLAIIGGTGSGKTTIAVYLLGARRGTFAVCAVKNAHDDRWGGLLCARARITAAGPDLSAYISTVDAVWAETWRRHAEGVADADEQITLVVDDYNNVSSKVVGMRDKILDIVELGRSARVRIILLATEREVDAWDWKGRGGARDNLLFIDIQQGSRAASMFGWQTRRQPTPIETSGIVKLAQDVSLRLREWSGLSAVLARVDEQTAPSAQQTQTAPSAQQLRSAPDEIYDLLISQQMTRDAGAAWMSANGFALDNNRWAARRQALGVAQPTSKSSAARSRQKASSTP